MAERFINIRFPFEDSTRGFFVELNQTTKDAVKSDLLHLLFTDKGSRYYLPTFGTNLRRYIFEPNDTPTHEDIMSEIQDAVNTFLPGLRINDIAVTIDPNDENIAVVNINFSVGEGVFEETDTVQIAISQ
jgi:phage baseplate assembly protein W